jgi:serine/threonine protein kinase/WD40 repeat protein
LGETGTPSQQTNTQPISLVERPAEPDGIGLPEIKDYELLEEIGQGGMGVVYRARQISLKREVAVKIIKLGMDTQSIIRRFDIERQALALMDHPGIAKVIDAGMTRAGRSYFVLELVQGLKITDYCDQNRLSTATRLELFIKVCQAVQHAHQRGVIHRDLKPANILVAVQDGAAVPKIIDFGIAKATEGGLSEQTVMTALGHFIGTPAYMSPEQTESGLDFDTRSDIYSLGVLLYELLTGHLPFEPKELAEAGLDSARRTIREKDPLRPSTRLRTLAGGAITTAARCRQVEPPKLVHLIQGDLDWIVMKCLEKDRTRRYETANGLASDLRRHLKNESVLARPPSRLYEFQRTVRRHKFGFGAAALVVAALSVGIAASLWQASRARRAERQQRRTAQEAQYRAYVSDMNLAHRSLLERDLGGARALLRAQVPKPGAPDLRNWEWRFLANECRGQELRALAAHRGCVSSVRFIDDNTLLSTGYDDRRAVCWNLADGRPAPLMTNEHSNGFAIGKMALASKRGLLFYAPDWGNTVRSLDLRTGVASEFCTNASTIFTLALSPNEDLLAVGAGGRVVELWDSNTKRAVPCPVPTPGEVNAVAFSPDGRHLALACGDRAGTLMLHDLIDNTDVTTVRQRAGNCIFSPDGRWLVCGLGFDFARNPGVRRADDLSLIRALDDSAATYSAAFSPDGKWLATVGGDETVHLWDTATWEIRFALKGHTDAVVCVAFSPNSRLLATGTRNGEVKVWEVAEPPPRWESVELPASSDEGQWAVGIARDGSAFWSVELEEAAPGAQVQGAGARVVTGETWLASSLSQLGTVRLDDLSLANCADVSPGGRTFAVGCLDTIHFRGITDTNDLAKGDAGEGTIRLLQISMDGSVLVSVCASNDWTVRAWRLPQMELLGERKGIPKVQQLCLSDDSKSVAIFVNGGFIGTLDLPSLAGPPLWKATDDVANWTACAFSPDSRRVAAALRSGNAFIWDLATRQRVALPLALTEYTSLSFSPDGSRLLASDNKTVQLFDTTTGQKVLSLNQQCSHVAFTRNGEGLLCVSLKSARMLHAPPLGQLQFDWLAESSRP